MILTARLTPLLSGGLRRQSGSPPPSRPRLRQGRLGGEDDGARRSVPALSGDLRRPAPSFSSLLGNPEKERYCLYSSRFPPSMILTARLTSLLSGGLRRQSGVVSSQPKAGRPPRRKPPAATGPKG